MSFNGTRKETKYRDSKSRSGEYSPKISPALADRIKNYCKLVNMNKNTFVEEHCKEALDKLEREAYENMSKEELVELLLTGRR